MAHENPNPDIGEEVGLVAWRKLTVPYAEAITAAALLWHDRAEQARNLYGAKAPVVEHLERIAYCYRIAAGRAQKFYGSVTTRNRQHFYRLFNPRNGNLVAEARADNAAAVRDHVNMQRKG